ncbi:hypothetical protein ACIPSA_48990 [Streptomyces sp. NPDC086549]|uniref:hypothetical protein n=1 Tax=Streptomyces sp. NPDC086549 TaxID=3365752 RepID=UPI00381CEE46
MPQLAFVHTFWTDYEQLDKPVRAGVRKAMAKFQSLTVAELYADKGLGLSVARMARDPRMRTIRITAFWRGVLLAPDDGSETFLLRLHEAPDGLDGYLLTLTPRAPAASGPPSSRCCRTTRPCSGPPPGSSP